MLKRMTDSQISSIIERLGLKREDIIIQDPKSEILSGMAQMSQNEICSVTETTDFSQLLIIDPESLY
ncbi:MAG: hypothetical protein K2N27_02430 [Ruminococcus sp.]|nr:hypothetical protein [Ruminococcus sp.]